MIIFLKVTFEHIDRKDPNLLPSLLISTAFHNGFLSRFTKKSKQDGLKTSGMKYKCTKKAFMDNTNF